MNKKKDIKPVIVTTGHLMKIFGVGRTTITNWRKKGMEEASTARGKWNFLDVIKFWAENVYYPEGNESIITYRERWEKARAEKIELDLSERKFELYPADVVDQYLEEIIHVAKTQFQLVPDQAIGLMVGMVPEAQRAVLQNLVNEILTAISDRATLEQTKKRIKDLA